MRRAGPRDPGGGGRVVDPAGVLGATGLGRLARAGKAQRLAHLSADRLAGQSALARPERQVLDVLLAAAIGLEPDRWHYARLGTCGSAFWSGGPRLGRRPGSG